MNWFYKILYRLDVLLMAAAIIGLPLFSLWNRTLKNGENNETK